MRHCLIIATLLLANLGQVSSLHAAEQPESAVPVATTPSVQTPAAEAQIQALKAKWKRPEPAATEGNWLRRQSPQIARAADSSGAWRAVLALLVVAGLVTFTWFARQRSKTSPIGASLGNIRILSSTRIGPKAQMVVAEIAGQTFLLGVTEHNITRLAEVGEPPRAQRPIRLPVTEEDEGFDAYEQIPMNGAGRFAEMLKTTLNTKPRDRARAASDQAVDETDDVVSSHSTLRSTRRPRRWNLDEQASGLFAQSNGKS